MLSVGITCLVSLCALLDKTEPSDAVVTAMAWMTAHLPFIMGYILAAASLSRLVLATDCHDANAEDLTEAYISDSQGGVPTGLRWFYCGGLGIALLFMSIHLPCLSLLSATNCFSHHLTLPHPQRIRWSAPLQALPPPRPRLHRHNPHFPTPRQNPELSPISLYHNRPCRSRIDGRRLRLYIDL